MELTKDDLVRRAVIQALACHFRLSIESIESSYLVDFADYFSGELEDLLHLQEDGLVELQPDWIVVTPKGRLLVRAVCMVFDRYLRERTARATLFQGDLMRRRDDALGGLLAGLLRRRRALRRHVRRHRRRTLALTRCCATRRLHTCARITVAVR